MKLLFVLSLLSIITLSNSDCKQKKEKKSLPTKSVEQLITDTLRGKLEIAGICKNYTISLLEGKMDSSLFESSWKNEADGKTYQNVFRLGNPCNFPESIRQGSPFYFIIDTTRQEGCMVCEAYYPTPVKKVNIKVVKY
jgi:hypothetical protein